MEVTPQDMAIALQGNPLAMEQAKVVALLRENRDLSDTIESLKKELAEARGEPDASTSR